MTISFTVNSKTHQVTEDLDMPLLWFLRDYQSLTGTKFGCGIGQCGACTVHLNGKAIRACSISLGQLQGAKITTIEGLSKDGNHPVQKAWKEIDVPQCGYCQPGQIMATAAMLNEISNPNDEQISERVTNICRCGTYTRIRKAIHLAAELSNSDL